MGNYYLGGSIPARRNIISHKNALGHEETASDASKAKVTNFEITISIHEQVSWFEIAVEHSPRMNILKAAQDLVEEKLVVLIGECLIRLYNLRKVAFHEISHHVPLLKTLQIFWQQDGFWSEHILMV